MVKDLIAENFGWIDPIITDPDNPSLFREQDLSGIQKELSGRWVEENRQELLNELALKYGEVKVLTVIDRIVSSVSSRNWKENGKGKDNSLENFIKILWGPLASAGFEYTSETSGNTTRFTVTKCPIAALAGTIGAEKWLYHLVCLTDEPSVTGYNSNIRFTRDQTLMQGHPICNHCYKVLSGPK